MTSIASSNSFAFLNSTALNATVNQTTAPLTLTPKVIDALQNERRPEDVTIVIGPNGKSWTV
jgi:hypothetical protein